MPTAPNDLDSLDGVWSIATLEIDGAPIDRSLLSGATIAIANGRFTTSSMGAEYSGKFVLGPLPGQLALHFETGPEAGNINHGRFERHGNGWRLCLNLSGGPVPPSFATFPGSGFALETLVRVEAPLPPATSVASSDTPREPIPEVAGSWTMVSCLRSGDPLPASFLAASKRHIDGIHSTLHFDKQLFHKGYLYADPESPGAAILESQTGEKQLGIYAFDGPQLKTCFAGPGRPRPTAFASTKEGGETFSVWKRR